MLKDAPDEEAESAVRMLLTEAGNLLLQGNDAGFEAGIKAYKEAQKIGSEALAADCAIFVARQFYTKKEYRQAVLWFEKARDHYKLSQNTKYEAVCENNIGLVYFSENKWEEATNSYLKSLELKEQLHDTKGLGITCLNLGGVFFQRAKYPESLAHYNRAQEIFEQLNEKKLEATAIYNSGLIYSIDENFEMAVMCYNSALQKLSLPDDNPTAVNIYNNLGDAYRSLGRIKDSEETLLKCLEMCKTLNNRDVEAAALSNLSELKFLEDQYEDCRNYAAAALSIENQSDKNATIVAKVNLGRSCLALGKNDEGVDLLKNALDLAKSLEAKQHMYDIYKSLIRVCESTGDYKTAFTYQQEYLHIKDEFYSSRIDRKLAEAQYKHELENKRKEAEIERLRNVELKEEKEKSEKLLLNILPVEVANELKHNGKASAKRFENVTVLFTDFVSFSKVSSLLSAEELVGELDICFKTFDEIISKYNIEKIKTIGDAYLAVSGLPVVTEDHAINVLKAAIEIRAFIRERHLKLKDRSFGIRIGINSGSVVAGIVGVKKFAYDIWGDTVNTAARMEQCSEPGKINISQTTFELIKDFYPCQYRGEIEAKNKGKLKMYFVD